MTQQEKEKMFLDLNGVLVKFWKEQGRPDKEIKIELLERMLNWQKKAGIVIPDEQSKEPVSDDLEKEIKTWIPAHIVGGDEAPWKELKDVVIQWAGIVARHFYILGLKNNIPVTQITLGELAKEGEPVNEDLEEAAKKLSTEWRKNPDGSESTETFPQSFVRGFKAGAEWQAERLLKGSPMPEDTVIFQKGIEEGKRLMMEDAVEGMVCKDHIVTEKPFYFYQSRLIELPDNLKEGDKVKIVIVKEN